MGKNEALRTREADIFSWELFCCLEQQDLRLELKRLVNWKLFCNYFD